MVNGFQIGSRATLTGPVAIRNQDFHELSSIGYHFQSSGGSMSHPSHFTTPSPSKRHPLRTLSRLGVGGLLAYAGVGHLTFVREEFQAQVPDWVPMDDDTVVLLSGVAEIVLGAALLSGRHKKFWGRGAAAFFAAIFPGNVAQFVEHKDGFGLNDDHKRAIRLLFQPILVGLALEGTRED
ncbi:DoxX family protein [Cutibacterium modestum HL037PA3]|nr:DoxX family protein [Cutibacterium modestum HL037PA2]EFS92068.1 DoxX family protein [Cutibacterium modestum HL044PA1]EFT14167.1 DoxX family protein [Cutibacterium modestum HL037PA3]